MRTKLKFDAQFFVIWNTLDIKLLCSKRKKKRTRMVPWLIPYFCLTIRLSFQFSQSSHVVAPLFRSTGRLRFTQLVVTSCITISETIITDTFEK